VANPGLDSLYQNQSLIRHIDEKGSEYYFGNLESRFKTAHFGSHARFIVRHPQFGHCICSMVLPSGTWAFGQ
jgi:hypothetical protein